MLRTFVWSEDKDVMQVLRPLVTASSRRFCVWSILAIVGYHKRLKDLHSLHKGPYNLTALLSTHCEGSSYLLFL